MGLAGPNGQQGFSAEGTRFVNIDLIPPPGATLGLPGYSLTIPLVNPLPPDARLELHSGNVEASSVTATFRRIASFSTVGGLLPSPQTAGDVNGDKVVDCIDVSIVRTALGKSARKEGFDARADINGNAIVNRSDLAFVLKQLPKGTSCQ